MITIVEKQLKLDQCREKASTSKTKGFVLGEGEGLYRNHLWLHGTVRGFSLLSLGRGPGQGGAEAHPDLFAGEPKSVLGESTWELGLSILLTEGLTWVFRSPVWDRPLRCLWADV